MQQEQNRSEPNGVSVDGAGSSAPEIYGFLAEAASVSAWKPEGASGGKNSRGAFEQVGVSKDDFFKLLSNPRRRYALYYLTQHASEVDLGTLATQIAAWENDVTVAEVSGMERKRVYTSLQQVHLPKMDETGVVAFDKRSGTITPKASLTDYEFGGESHSERPWYGYYGLLSAGNAGIAALTLSNVWALAAVSDGLVMVWILLSYVFLTVVHTAVSTNAVRTSRVL